MAIHRRACDVLLVVVVLIAGCGDADFPVSPAPVVNTNVTTVSGGSWSGSIIIDDGSTTAFNMTLIGRGIGQETSALTRQTVGTIDVTGNFETAIGLKGTIHGELNGTLQNGSFNGLLTADSPACSRQYSGPITESTVAWIPSGSLQPGCPLTFSVQLPRPRGPACQYVVSLSRQTFSGNGGNGELRITTGPACTWAAESLDSWLDVDDPQPRIGSGRVTFSARPNQQNAREGRLRVAIANQTFMIAQGPACTYAVSPRALALPASGGSSEVSVTAPAECEWSAQSSVPWLTLAPTRGSGSGTVTVTAQVTSGPPRNAAVSVAGETVSVSQGGGCDVTVNPGSVLAVAGGGSFTLQVSAESGCSWTAQTGDSWIVLAPSSSNNGPGVVSFRVTSSQGPGRDGTIQVGERIVVVRQASGCTYVVSPNQPPSVPQSGSAGNIVVTVATDVHCEWQAEIESGAPWLTLVGSSPTEKTGSGEFAYSVAENPGQNAPSRSGRISITGDNAVKVAIVINQQGAPVLK